MTEYLIYTLRGQGFVGRTGQATTQRGDAKRFAQEEAVSYSRKHLDHNGMSTMYPVAVALLDEIEAAV